MMIARIAGQVGRIRSRLTGIAPAPMVFIVAGLCVASVLSVGLCCAPAWAGNYDFDGSASDDWNDGSNWSGGIVPGSGAAVDNARIGTSAYPGKTADISNTQPPVPDNLYSIRVGHSALSAGTLNILDGASVTASQEYCGADGYGVIDQTGGSNTATYVYIAYGDGSTGLYDQSGGALNVRTLFVGVHAAGSGTYRLSAAGSLNASSSLSVEHGSVEIHGGSVTAPSLIFQADDGGTMSIGGGTVTVTTLTQNAGSGGMTMTDGELTVSGVWTRSGGTFNATGGTVTFNGAQQTLGAGFAVNTAFFNLTHDGSGTLGISGDLDVNGTLYNKTGGFDPAGYTVYLAGDFKNDVTMTASGTLAMNGASAQEIVHNGTNFFTGLTIDNAGAGTMGVVTLSGAAGTLALGSGGTLTLASGTFDIGSKSLTGGTFAAMGPASTLRLAGDNALTFTDFTAPSAAGTWEYAGRAGGSGAITVKDFGAADYYDLAIAKRSDSADAFTIDSDLQVAHELAIAAGSFDIGGHGVTVGGAAASTGDITVGSGGILSNDGTLDGGNGTLVVSNGGTLKGSGTIMNITGTIAAGAVLAPGDSPGTLTQSGGAMIWEGGAALQWEIDDADGEPGTNWDRLLFIDDAALTVTAVAGNRFAIDIMGLSGGEPGDPAHFDAALDYVWLLADYTDGSLTGAFNPDVFSLTVSGFETATGTFAIINRTGYSYHGSTVDGIFITYGGAGGVPEPATFAGIAIVLGAAAFRRRGLFRR